MALFNTTFRYRGEINWDRFFKGGRDFWLDLVDPDDFQEVKYKDKGNEFEGKWKITHKYDPYHQFVYSVDFKAIDMKASEKKGFFTGKLRVYVEVELKQHFKDGDIAGSKVIFEDKSFLHKLYKRLTTREREENLEDVGIGTVHNFVDFLKELCNQEARYG